MGTSNRAVVGALPDTVELVIGVKDLAALRTRPQARALEGFLTDASDWSRTTAAWTELSRKLDMDLEQSIQALLGGSAVVASEWPPSPEAAPRFVVLSSIDAESRRDVARRLGTVPRSITGDATVMTLEQGTFHFATRTWTTAQPDQAQLILASDKPLFDRVVQSMSGRATGSTLSGLKEWPRIAPLAEEDVFLLGRKRGTQTTEATYFSLAGTPTPRGWTARFSASDTVISEGVAEVQSGAPWPSEAVDQLETESSLLVAGSAHAAPGSPATLLSGLLSMMALPAEFQSQLEGAAIVSLTLPTDTKSGTALVIALPLRDIAAGVDLADQWAESIAGTRAGSVDAEVTVTDGVREAAITPDNPAIINGYVRAEGRMAWCFAAAGGVIRKDATPGWVVVSLRFGAGEEPSATVRRTASLLAHDEGKDTQTLFRLVVEPRRITAWAKEHSTTAAASPASLRPTESGLTVSQSALRWLERVDSRIVRDSPGFVEGTVTIDLNLSLLDVSAAPTTSDKGEPARPNGQ